MANFEYEFNNQDRQLVTSQDAGELTNNDYIKLTVYTSSNTIVALADGNQAIFYSTLNSESFDINVSPSYQKLDEFNIKTVGGSIDSQTGLPYNDFKIYQTLDGDGNVVEGSSIYLKPNEIFNTFGLPQGNYLLKVDFLNQVGTSVYDYNEIIDSNCDYGMFINPSDLNNNTEEEAYEYALGIWPTIGMTSCGTTPTDTSWRYTVCCPNGINGGSQRECVDDPGGEVVIVPVNNPLTGEVFYDTYGEACNPTPELYEFLIKEISTSRKEVRLKLKNKNISTFDNGDVDSEVILNITRILNDDTDAYKFKHLLNYGTDDNIPIMNYQFDAVTDGRDNQSIILKLYDQLPLSVNNLSWVTIEKEVLITQNLDVYYFSDVEAQLDGDGLTPDDYENWIIPDNNDIDYQNYNDLSASLSDISLQSVLSASNNYPNLNTDYTFFENHTFFGSAKRKVINFKNKIETIQGHYSDISKSLSAEGGAIGGDSIFLVQERKNLFKKINDEIQTFTPYETFLYYDGQNESTASAPGVGLNYANKVPVTETDNYQQLNNYDGLNTVYKNSNKNLSGFGTINLFTDKYRVHEAPFFNFSGSVYISFLLKGTDGISLIHENSNNKPYNGLNGILLPSDTFFKSSILEPLITGSEYKRVIIEASQSYFVPSSQVPPRNDFSSIDDFSTNSNQITILNGSIKTGSFNVKDSSGKYQNLTTVVTSSGVPFKGSAMPAGELFRISFNTNTEASEVSQSFVTDIKVTINNPSDTLPFDNLYHTSSANWIDWYNTTYTNAETFDTDNIHSLENNLPAFIKNDSAYNEFKDFLSLQGEQYDLIRNHVDSLGTLHNRGYTKKDSPPENIFPILLDNMGWEAINPFSGSLSDSLGNYLTGVTSIDDIKNNTWRKTLNNLLYLYKTKGTVNSVRGLLNIYGYPPDVLKIQEFGGSTNNVEDTTGLTKVPDQSGVVPASTVDLDLRNMAGGFSFTSKKENLYNWIYSGESERAVGYNWWTNQANINSLDFVYKHVDTAITQTILESSGSGALRAVSLMQVKSSTISDFDGKLLIISSSDGTGKTYIFDDDDDGATGTIDGSGRVRIQIIGLTNNDEIATEISTSISHVNGHFGKIKVSDSIQFLTNTEQSFITSDGFTLFANSSGSVILTQLTASVNGNKVIGGNIPSATILTSSFTGGSDEQTLWDLRLIPSTGGESSSFAFRLNNTPQASSSIISASNVVSMSTNFTKMHDGQLWNVMVQRMTSSISGSGTNEYRLHTSFQDASKIKTYNYVTMSVSGGISKDSNYFANQNWISTGSRHILSSSNLITGKTLTGSLSQIKGWSTALSISRFRQHTLNKFSTVGNTIDSHKKELIYHFKLNENYTTASVSSSTQKLDIIDASSTTTFRDYSFKVSGSLVTGSLLYGRSNVDTIKFGLQDNNTDKKNDNNIIINSKFAVIGNLNPYKSSIKSITAANSKPLFNTSVKLEFTKSPTDKINQYILNNMDTFNFENYYGNPKYQYSSSYTEFDTLRNQFFDSHNLSVDTNKFIRAHENIFNPSMMDGIKKLVPARSTLSDRNSNFGVMIKPTILEKQKYEGEKHSVAVNPNSPSGSILFTKNTEYKQSLLTSTYEEPKSGSISMGNSYITSSEYSTPQFLQMNGITSSVEFEKSGSVSSLPRFTGSLELPYSASISMGNSYTTASLYVTPPFIQLNGVTSSIEFEKSGSILPLPTFTGSLELPYSASISFGNSYVTSSDSKYIIPKFLRRTELTSSVEFEKSGSVSSLPRFTGSLELPYSASISMGNSYKTGSNYIIPSFLQVNRITSSIVFPYSGSINYASIANESFVNIHDSWGTGTTDTHFINYNINGRFGLSGGTGSNGDYNVGSFESRYHFNMIGDTEIYSASRFIPNNYSNHTKFYNRTMISDNVHSGVTYEPHINGNPGSVAGRMIGKTRYFSASADGGTLTFPTNHVSKFSQPFKEQMNNGTQNNNPGILNVQYEDYSTASFYSVTVTGGENQIIVKGNNNPKIDSSERIIY